MAPESNLISRLKNGEREAFAELYDRYGKNLYAVIYTIVPSVEEAENLLQDTFVKIWRNIGRYDETKGRLYTWLVVIARRRALDYVRSADYLDRKMNQPADSLVSVSVYTPEMNQLDHIGLEKAVRKLSPALKQVIDLQYFMGYTQQEVADEFGIPLGTVKSRTRTALQELRQLLAIDT